MKTLGVCIVVAMGMTVSRFNAGRVAEVGQRSAHASRFYELLANFPAILGRDDIILPASIRVVNWNLTNLKRSQLL